jgi:hypothetical protein
MINIVHVNFDTDLDPTDEEDGDTTGITFVTAPASSSSTGTVDQVAYDDDYFYVCIATDTWRRFPLTDW